jgi:hypothetical protein
MAVQEDYQTVGHLYRGIEQGLERLVERSGESGVFIGPPQAQATTAVFEWSELTAVTTLATTAKHLMNWVMRPLGSLLTTLPVGPDRPGVLTGPAFEIVQPSFYVLPHREAAWRIMAERLQQLADRADRLSGTAGLAQLAELATDLHGMACDIESA